ncbi:DNA-binding LytR/AlgR family response regulator [Lewinella aquimaris]|uniref:DNA-binding LytR/AlgR family response regulator n=1 Tax=Neolewinella aquimaris TaxID=1835722 RepID=A0A840DX52_9BACT|nr:LytTR family DNA-binding domain-containing protein [Neolewinella aquimaris]MBB4077581.1 DNA-binding LytR/AlgR family response regulator [Neolewinella aquimaris]
MNSFNSQPMDHLFLREGTTYIKIPLTDIHYIQADGNYAYIQTRDKRFAVKRSLATIAEELEAGDFVRASRGLLVNFTQVNRISFADGVIELDDHQLKMGKAYHADIKSRMPRL